MQRRPIVFRPGRNLSCVCRVRIDSNNNHRPLRVTITEGGLVAVDAARRAVHRIKLHCRMKSRYLFSIFQVFVDRSIWKLAKEVAPPIPLQTRWIYGVEHALQSRVRHRAHKLKPRHSELPNWTKRLFNLVQWTTVSPDDPAHR